MNTCKLCHYAVKDGGDLYCHRYPPTAVMLPRPAQSPLLTKPGQPQQMQLVPAGVLPFVTETQWCGEFKSKLQ